MHSGYQRAHDRYSYLPCLSWAIVVGAGAAWVASGAARRSVEGRLLWLARAACVAWLSALAMCGAVLLISDILFKSPMPVLATGAIALAFIFFWALMPLIRRGRMEEEED